MLITRLNHQWHFTHDNNESITLSVNPHFFLGKKSLQNDTFLEITKIRLSNFEEYIVGHNIVVPIHVYEHLIHEYHINHPIIHGLFHIPKYYEKTPSLYEQIEQLPIDIKQIIAPHCTHLKHLSTPHQNVESFSSHMLS